jgi:tRNA modification GTPase
LLCREWAQPSDAKHDGSASNDVLVFTKCDLQPSLTKAFGCAENGVVCSSVTGEGLDALANLIRSEIAANERGPGAYAALTSARCLASLREAERALVAAVELTANAGDELIAAEIRAALDALGDVVGATTADDVLDRIFSQFCIGK